MLWNRFSVCFVRSWSRDALKEIIFFTRECLKFNFFCSSFFFFLRFLNFSFFSSSRIQRRLRQAREEKKCIDPLLLCYFVPLPLVVLISPSLSLSLAYVWVVKKEFFFLYNFIRRERCEAKNPSHRTMFFILIFYIFSWSIEQT